MKRGVLPVVAGLSIVFAACSGGSTVDQATDPGTTASTISSTVPSDPEVDLQLVSTAFDDGGPIPQPFTCDGADVSPPLTLIDVPAEAVTLVLVMDDPDAPSGTWDHWVAFDIPVMSDIPEDVGELGTPGMNSWGRSGYGGPCPPSGTHRYFFSVYALDTTLGLDAGVGKADVLDAIAGRTLAGATLMGTYARS